MANAKRDGAAPEEVKDLRGAIEWMKKEGGVNAIYERNKRKSETLYRIVDDYKDFYLSRISPECRSMTNIMFYLKDEALTALFLDEATKIGLANLRGHRVSGGVRASIYNAMPEEGVNKLAEFMKQFAINPWRV